MKISVMFTVTYMNMMHKSARSHPEVKVAKAAATCAG